MNYFISRENQQYGPYTLADLQRYVGTGEVLTSDLATSEGVGAPVTVGEIIGNIAAPPAYSTAYPASAAFPVATLYSAPPNLHWGLVLLFTILSCGLFGSVWELVQAAWLKKVEPGSKALVIYIVAIVLLVGIFFVSFVGTLTGRSKGVYRTCPARFLHCRDRRQVQLQELDGAALQHCGTNGSEPKRRYDVLLRRHLLPVPHQRHHAAQDARPDVRRTLGEMDGIPAHTAAKAGPRDTHAALRRITCDQHHGHGWSAAGDVSLPVQAEGHLRHACRGDPRTRYACAGSAFIARISAPRAAVPDADAGLPSQLRRCQRLHRRLLGRVRRAR